MGHDMYMNPPAPPKPDPLWMQVRDVQGERDGLLKGNLKLNKQLKAANKELKRIKKAMNILNVKDDDAPDELDFCLAEQGDGSQDEVTGTVIVDKSGMLNIRLDGFSDHSSEEDGGIPILLEYYEGSVIVRVYADINEDDPTDCVYLDGARNDKRIPDDGA